MPYVNGVISVGTTATLIASPSSSVPESQTVLIQNLGTTILYLGGPGVTAGVTATGGYQVPASGVVAVPTTGSAAEPLYGVSTAALNVAFLYPG